MQAQIVDMNTSAGYQPSQFIIKWESIEIGVFDHDKVSQRYGKQHSPNGCVVIIVEISRFVLPYPLKRIRH